MQNCATFISTTCSSTHHDREISLQQHPKNNNPICKRSIHILRSLLRDNPPRQRIHKQREPYRRLYALENEIQNWFEISASEEDDFGDVEDYRHGTDDEDEDLRSISKTV